MQSIPRSKLESNKLKKTGLTAANPCRKLQKIWLPIIFVIFPLLMSCAPLQIVGEKIQGAYWNLQKDMRKPGEELLTHPNDVWKKYDCGNKKLPMLSIENNEIMPPKLPPGKELNHHFEYVMCPAKPSQVIQGNLTRLIYYKNQVIFKDVSRNFEFKPGKWSLDAFITIANEAKPGVYSLEVKFSGMGQAFSKSEHFVVTAKKP